jgi:ribonuclease HII
MSSGRNVPDSFIPPIFSYDENMRSDHAIIAGLDEAGRGPLAGPVVAAAVILPAGIVIDGLRDSKRIAEKQRKKVFWQIVRNALSIGVGIIEAEEIDRINILQSTKRAMECAIKDLPVKPDVLLIDAVSLTNTKIKQNSIIKGESVSASIAAASIIAKVVRDDIMLDYDKKYPAYNFESHKGYGTREHVECIRQYGPCPIHRKSFRKVGDVQIPFG